MPPNNQQFINELNQVYNQFVQEAEQFTKEITADILKEITDVNPIDTGKSTASWIASLDFPVYSQASDVTEANTVPRSVAQERSLSTLNNISSYKLGQKIFLSNGTDYISDLEAGKSLQAENFVALSALRYDEVITWKINIP